MRRANEQLAAQVARSKRPVERLEQENQRLSTANESVRRDVGEVSDCCPKVKKDLTNLEREIAKLKEEMRTARPKAEPLAPAAADGVVLSVPKATVPRGSHQAAHHYPNVAPAQKQTKQFPPFDGDE
jgi:septal ring factor EnvC (AmiA/AmiB activator)